MASRVCEICQKPGTYYCTGCKTYSYCSVECQRRDWTEYDHATKCATIASRKKAFPDWEAWSELQAVFKELKLQKAVYHHFSMKAEISIPNLTPHLNYEASEDSFQAKGKANDNLQYKFAASKIDGEWIITDWRARKGQDEPNQNSLEAMFGSWIVYLTGSYAAVI
jgi:hypothetical protein